MYLSFEHPWFLVLILHIWIYMNGGIDLGLAVEEEAD